MIMKNIGYYILFTGYYILIKSENGNRPLRHVRRPDGHGPPRRRSMQPRARNQNSRQSLFQCAQHLTIVMHDFLGKRHLAGEFRRI